MSVATPTITVSIDTEEEGLWGGDFPVRNCTTENLRGLGRFQSLCERYAVPPTYLIDAPVLEDPIAVMELRSWQNQRTCEIGTHCHPWCTPPLVSEVVSHRDSFMCNLPEELQFQKLQWLTERIAESFGQSPVSYRAGRYGFDSSTVGPLLKLGYTVDSSVLPKFNYAPSGGPNFDTFARNPCRVTDTRGGEDLLEVLITTGFTRSGFYRLRQKIRRVVETPLGRKSKLAAISNRLGVTRHVKLSPEGTTLAELRDLVRSSLLAGVTHLVLMLHSTSLLPGYSPYAKDVQGVDALYERLEGALMYATKFHGCVGVTLSELPNRIGTEAVRSKS